MVDTEEAQAPGNPRRRLLLLLARVALAVGLLGYVVSIVASQWAQVKALPSPSGRAIAAFFGLMATYFWAATENWRAVMRGLEVRLNRRDAFRIIFLSNLAKYLPGGVWNLFGRVALCKAQGIAATTASVSLMIELVAQVFSMTVVALFSLSATATRLLPVGRWIFIPLLLAMLAAVHPRVINLALTLFSRISKRSLPLLTVTYPFILWMLVRYLLAWLLVAAAFAMLGQALTPSSLSLEDARLLLGAISGAWVLALMAIVVPGGLGVRELILTSLLTLRFSEAFAAALALAFRFGLLLLEGVAFGISLLLRRAD